MADDTYDKRRAQDQEVLRQWGLESLRKMAEEMPEAQRRTTRMVVGDRSFTVDEILREVDQDTEYGRLMLKAQEKLRIEQLRRG